jgi:hypothetical protein
MRVFFPFLFFTNYYYNRLDVTTTATPSPPGHVKTATWMHRRKNDKKDNWACDVPQVCFFFPFFFLSYFTNFFKFI